MKKLWIMAVAMTFGVAFTASAAWIWSGPLDGSLQDWTDPDIWDTDADDGLYPGESTTRGLGTSLGASKTVNLELNSVLPMSLAGQNEVGNGAGGNVIITIGPSGGLIWSDLWIGRNDSTGTVNVNGGTTSMGAWVRVGAPGGTHNSNGFLNIRDGGTVNITGNGLLVGRDGNTDHGMTSIVTIEDGLLSVSASSVVKVTEGSRNPGQQYITLNHLDAVFRWGGYKETEMVTLIATQYLLAGHGFTWLNGGPTYDSELNITELRVIPEPGTIALLGLAGLVLLIRRRRSVK